MQRQIRTIVSTETLIISRVSETVLEVFDEELPETKAKYKKQLKAQLNK